MHNYGNLCIIMHPTDTILLSSLRLIMIKAHAKFQPGLCSGFWEKVEHTRTQTRARSEILYRWSLVLSYGYYSAPYQFRPGLMIFLDYIGSEFSPLVKILGQKCCYHELFYFKIGTFLDLTLQNGTFPDSSKFQENSKFLLLIVFPLLLEVITKRYAKKLKLCIKIGWKSAMISI